MCIHAIFPLNVYIVNLSVSQGSSILKVGKSVDTLVLKCYTKSIGKDIFRVIIVE